MTSGDVASMEQNNLKDKVRRLSPSSCCVVLSSLNLGYSRISRCDVANLLMFYIVLSMLPRCYCEFIFHSLPRQFYTIILSLSSSPHPLKHARNESSS